MWVINSGKSCARFFFFFELGRHDSARRSGRPGSLAAWCKPLKQHFLLYLLNCLVAPILTRREQSWERCSIIFICLLGGIGQTCPPHFKKHSVNIHLRKGEVAQQSWYSLRYCVDFYRCQPLPFSEPMCVCLANQLTSIKIQPRGLHLDGGGWKSACKINK